MNNRLIKLIFLFSITFISVGCDRKNNISMYLGQQPPKTTPKIFAPGIVSTEEHH